MEAFINRQSVPGYHQFTRRTRPRQRNLIIMYEPQQAVVMRQYATDMVPNVNPDEYRRRYYNTLMDTSVLIRCCRQLGIPDHIISPPNLYRH